MVQPMNDKEWANYMSKTMEAGFLQAHEKIIVSYSKMSTYEDYNGTFWNKIPGIHFISFLSFLTMGPIYLLLYFPRSRKSD